MTEQFVLDLEMGRVPDWYQTSVRTGYTIGVYVDKEVLDAGYNTKQLEDLAMLSSVVYQIPVPEKVDTVIHFYIDSEDNLGQEQPLIVTFEPMEGIDD